MPDNHELGVHIQLTEDRATMTQGKNQITSKDQIPPWAVAYILAVATQFDPCTTYKLGITRTAESSPSVWEIERRRREYPWWDESKNTWVMPK